VSQRSRPAAGGISRAKRHPEGVRQGICANSYEVTGLSVSDARAGHRRRCAGPAALAARDSAYFAPRHDAEPRSGW
jgi:hypothetical protein